jgi:formate dehydrogenase subunit delta
MHQSSDTLVRMANQIGKFFAVQGEERATAGISDHIRKFWEPRMKVGIFAHLDAGGEGLDPLVLSALKKLRTITNPDGSMMASGKSAAPAPAPKNGNGKGRKNGNGNGQRGKTAAR